MDQPPDLDHLGRDFFRFPVDVGGRFFIDGGKRKGRTKKSK
jgi:hypothetical protein